MRELNQEDFKKYQKSLKDFLKKEDESEKKERQSKMMKFFEDQKRRKCNV